MGVTLFYDLDRRSTRNLGVLRNFDTGAALNAGSTTRIQHASRLGISNSEVAHRSIRGHTPVFCVSTFDSGRRLGGRRVEFNGSWIGDGQHTGQMHLSPWYTVLVHRKCLLRLQSLASIVATSLLVTGA